MVVRFIARLIALPYHLGLYYFEKDCEICHDSLAVFKCIRCSKRMCMIPPCGTYTGTFKTTLEWARSNMIPLESPI